MNIDTGRRYEEQRTTEQQQGVDPRVRSGFDQVEEEIEELRQDNRDLRGELEDRLVEVAELREALEQRTEELEELREAKEEQGEYVETLEERLTSLEGDMTCPHCGGQVHAGHVETVYQEEVPGEGLLSSSTFDGPVRELTCPGCGEDIDVREQPEVDRDEITDQLRRFGIAAGEPVNEPPAEAAEAGETSED